MSVLIEPAGDRAAEGGHRGCKPGAQRRKVRTRM